MRFIHTQIKLRIFSAGLIALILFSITEGVSFAARIAGTDENESISTTQDEPKDQLPKKEIPPQKDTQKKEAAPPTDTTNKIIKVSPATPAVPEGNPAPIIEKTPASKQKNAVILPETSEEKAKAPSTQPDAIKGENVTPPSKELPAVKKAPNWTWK